MKHWLLRLLPQLLAPPPTSCLCGSDSSRDSCEWNQTVFAFLCLLLSPSITSAKVHPFRSECQSHFYYGWVALIHNNSAVWMGHVWFIHHPLMDTWDVSTFWLLNHGAMNMGAPWWLLTLISPHMAGPGAVNRPHMESGQPHKGLSLRLQLKGRHPVLDRTPGVA